MKDCAAGCRYRALCIGCGACENACPAWPHRAVYVEGLPRHAQAERQHHSRLF
ncbi:MAG TPA: 4Fe-4S binding protein [bacterium]|nr:4Fe-4S binding protein [bacterium]